MKQLRRFFQRAQLWGMRRVGHAFRVQVQRPLQAHGSVYGGWQIDPTAINANSVVYSFGVGEDISFDLSLIETFGCHVYAFDPTPKSIAWLSDRDLPSQFHFFAYGVADFDGEARFSPPVNPEDVSYTLLERPETAQSAINVPVHRLQTIMGNLGHNRIDILKMDIEGAEYAVLQQLRQSPVRIGQLLIEFHHRFESVGWHQTAAAIKLLENAGFHRFYVSPSGEEFSFTVDNA